MATKDTLMRLLQELRGLSDITQPHLPPRASALFLAQMRSHMRDASRPRRRLIVTLDPKEVPGFPEPVEIIHLKTDSGV